jgi:alpha-glucosidase
LLCFYRYVLLTIGVGVTVFGPSRLAAAQATHGAEHQIDFVDRQGRHLTIDALTPDIIRVRISRTFRSDEDASWAVERTQRMARVSVARTTRGFSTGDVAVEVEPETLHITVRNAAGATILDDASTPLSIQGDGFTLRKQMPSGEHIFGLGDKTGGLDRAGQSFVNWNTDAYGFGPATDPIYKSIPFFIGTNASGASYGLLLDNSWRSWFDFGHRDAGVIELGSNGGPIDYYIIAGPSIGDVVRRYTNLTGKAPLVPRWALGYQQSRWSYMSADEVRALVARFRVEHFPLDVVWLDIDYQDRNRPFTINRTTFPDLKGLIGELARNGVHTVPIVDLHIAAMPGYAPYDSGIAGNHFGRFNIYRPGVARAICVSGLHPI